MGSLTGQCAISISIDPTRKHARLYNHPRRHSFAYTINGNIAASHARAGDRRDLATYYTPLGRLFLLNLH